MSNRESQRQLINLDKLQKENKDIVLIAISKDRRDDVKQKVAEMKTSCIVVADSTKIFRQYAIKEVPDSYYIDRYGSVLYHVTGKRIGSQDDVARRIKAILGNKNDSYGGR